MPILPKALHASALDPDGRVFLLPAPLVSAGSAGAALRRVPASGRGTVHAVTVTRRRPDQGGDYAIALVELAEGGPRIMSTVVGIPPGDVRIGMAVAARVTERNGVMAVVFQTAKQ